MTEEWRDIKGYEDLYQVSNLGRVRSLDRYEFFSLGKRFRKGIIIKSSEDKNGYNRVSLTKDGKQKFFFVHRLVAEAFIPNPNNLPFINHKDEVKYNNCVDNLEWCTHEYNMNYGNRLQKCSKSLTNRRDLSKSVLQFTLDGTFVAEYPSTMEAERMLGVNHSSISACCRGKKYLKTVGGYKWRYK